MLTSARFLILITVCGLVFPPNPVTAQSKKTIQIPADKLDCLLEHREKYLGVPRAVVSFTPAYCPALSKAEVIAAARAAQNSAGDKDSAILRRNLLNKERLRCMFEQLAAYREENPNGDASNEIDETSEEETLTSEPQDGSQQAPEIIEVSLDCS